MSAEGLALTPQSATDAQRIAILYRLTQSTPLKVGEGFNAESDEIGLGFLDCDNCDSDQKEELGCHRFGNRLTGRKWTMIDYTGGAEHDRVMFCPRSCLDQNPPGRVSADDIYQAISRARKIKALGGPATFEGQAPAELPPRYNWFYATFEGVVTRYKAEVNDALSRLSAKVSRARSLRSS